MFYNLEACLIPLTTATNVDVPLTFMSMINFMLSYVEHENSFITMGPGFWVSD